MVIAVGDMPFQDGSRRGQQGGEHCEEWEENGGNHFTKVMCNMASWEDGGNTCSPLSVNNLRCDGRTSAAAEKKEKSRSDVSERDQLNQIIT